MAPRSVIGGPDSVAAERTPPADDHHGTRAGHDDRPVHAASAVHDARPDPDGGASVGHGGHQDHGGHQGHGGHGGDHIASFRRRFWVSLVLTVPVVATSHMIMDWFGYELTFPGVMWVGPVLGTFIYLWGGWPFLAGAAGEIRARRPGMMLLIAMAITVAYTASMATSLGWFSLDFWWELAALITIMLLGHWQEMKALGQAQDALAALAALLPDDAERIEDDGEVVSVPLADLVVGAVVLVRPGARVPADGVVVAGDAEIDESMITGESRPVPKGVGDRVVAATIATDSALRVRVEAVGEDTALAGIQRLVAAAQSSRSRAQVLADRAAALLFYVATGAAVVTFLVWTAVGSIDDAVVRVVTVLVISCPHALGLATPLVTSLSSAMAARNGILIKDRRDLEASRTVDTFLFDKTGTLTRGQHVVTGLVAATGSEPAEILRLAAAVEADSEHPLARAIVAAATEGGSPVSTASGFRSLAGRGVEATIDGVPHAVGGPALQRERHLDEPPELATEVARWRERGAAVLWLVRGDSIIGALALEDEIRPEALAAVDELHRLGRRVVMITGDAREVAAAVGAELGIDEVLAEVLPQDKEARVAELQAQGRTVAMVGDGVNDAPALARADVGIAIGAGTDVAIESAGIILASSDPRAVVSTITLSRAAYRKSLQNLGWAAGYNIIAIPVAAGALAWAGIDMPPALGAALMSVSTIVVALNAQLLRRVDLRLDPVEVAVEPARPRDAAAVAP